VEGEEAEGFPEVDLGEVAEAPGEAYSNPALGTFI
jgi:hypothetical protein